MSKAYDVQIDSSGGTSQAYLSACKENLVLKFVVFTEFKFKQRLGTVAQFIDWMHLIYSELQLDEHAATR